MSYNFFERERVALEAATGGKNTYVYDDLGYPSVMVKIPKFMLSDVIDGAPNEVHPAFIVNKVQKDYIYISKYLNIVEFNRAYSLPGKDPRAYINFDTAVNMCKNKGAGWHLMSNSEWAAIALWCQKNGTIPNGNNLGGCDHANRLETGAMSSEYGPHSSNWNNRCYRKDENGKFFAIGRTETGTGPNSWNHNWMPDGITDLNGNLWEWVSGLRLKNGEIQIFADNNAAIYGADFSVNSSSWKAILQDGSLVAPGTNNTLKINGTKTGNATQSGNSLGSSQILDIKRDKPHYSGGDVDDYYAYSSDPLFKLSAQSGVSIPDLLKYLGIANSQEVDNGDRLWVRNYGERLPLRGGRFDSGGGAGVFSLHLYYARSHSDQYVGFRSAFVPQ